MNLAITRMSQNGQVVIPADVRKEIDAGPKTQFLVFYNKKDIILRQVTAEWLEEEMEFRKSLAQADKDIREGRVRTLDFDNKTIKELDAELMRTKKTRKKA